MTPVFVAVCDCCRQSVFVVADLSVGAVEHSGVFSCDWDSLEEESLSWCLAVCAGHPAEDWGYVGGERGTRRASLLVRHTPSSAFFPVALICPPPPLLSLPSLIRGSSLVIW